MRMSETMIFSCTRCQDTGVVFTGGSTGPYGDDPLEEADCPVCVTGTEQPEEGDDD